MKVFRCFCKNFWSYNFGSPITCLFSLFKEINMCCPIPINMNTDNNLINANNAINQEHVHHHNQTSKISSIVMNALEKISAIALAVFSALTNMPLFIPFFFAGVSVGIYNYIEEKYNDEKKHYCEEEHKSHHSSSGCGGFLEQLTGVKLPAPLSLVANIGITICHIDHHDTIFVPIVALSVGTWAGQSACAGGDRLYQSCKKLSAHRVVG